MEIKEYRMEITVDIAGEMHKKSLVYYGNENIMMHHHDYSKDKLITIIIPRDILEKFLEMIE